VSSGFPLHKAHKTSFFSPAVSIEHIRDHIDRLVSRSSTTPPPPVLCTIFGQPISTRQFPACPGWVRCAPCVHTGTPSSGWVGLQIYLCVGQSALQVPPQRKSVRGQHNSPTEPLRCITTRTHTSTHTTPPTPTVQLLVVTKGSPFRVLLQLLTLLIPTSYLSIAPSLPTHTSPPSSPTNSHAAQVKSIAHNPHSATEHHNTTLKTSTNW
jgi:hypothetical protein